MGRRVRESTLSQKHSCWTENSNLRSDSCKLFDFYHNTPTVSLQLLPVKAELISWRRLTGHL